MATSGTPFEGRDNIVAQRVYKSTNLFLVLYENTADSLDASSVYADLVQPSGEPGYAAIVLLSTGWSSTNGVVTYDHGTPDNPIFQNTDPFGGATWTNPITGAAIVANNYILHFKDLDSPYTMTPQDKIEVDISNLVAP